jgi:hypothetical protein
MACPELAHLELLSEVDAVLERLRQWAEGAPAWQPAEAARAMVRRLAERAGSLRIRLEAPLVVATLGGTGTGKSALVNALVGAEVVQTGRRRPTTTRPTLICRPNLTPEMLGIDRHSIELVHRDLPALAELVLIDCPDPDTTEEADAAEDPAGEGGAALASGQREADDARQPVATEEGRGAIAAQRPEPPASNLARLRRILPQCDVLLVTTTQQKYRSARVGDELATAAPGARLVFVQTHADLDQDVREDWSAVLRPRYGSGHVFLVDCLAALAEAKQGLQPRGEFAGLVDLLTRQFAGAAAARIRRANFLDLVEETLARCGQRIDQAMPPVRQVRQAIDQQRTRLAERLAAQMRRELLASRRQWENRLLGQVASRWGLSPFALVLRIFQGLGGLLAGTLLWRARTPAQMALWGTLGGVRVWQRRRQQRQADRTADRAVAGCWEQAELRSAALVLEGYAAEAGLDRQAASPQTVLAEAGQAGSGFVAGASDQLQSLIARLAGRHAGWFTRLRYELLLGVMLVIILYRLAKNFFWDSWLAAERVDVFGLDFYVSAGFWLLLWCLLLVWAFSSRLRRGLRREVEQLAEGWNNSSAVAGVFARLEESCQAVEQFRQDLDQLREQVDRLRRQLASPQGQWGSRLDD